MGVEIPESLLTWVMEATPDDVIERYAGLPQAAEQADFGEYDTNIVVIDTETTGVSLKKDELTQIAAAKLEHGEIVEWFVTFVNPGQPIPEDIVALTHITQADVEPAPSPDEALEQLVSFVGDAKLVAHNAYFDKSFVTKHPSGYPLLDNQWIDSLELSRIALPRMKSHRLIDLVKAFNAPLSTHRADADVVATCALYRILLAGVEAMPEALLFEIARFANPLEWPFGEVFAFFAERKRAAREEAGDGVVAQPGYVALPETLSLSKMRAPRVKSLDRPAKIDAARLLTQSMLDQMHNLGASVKTFDGQEPQVIQMPKETEIAAEFSETGILGTIYDDYEVRTEQVEMAQAVREAFEQADNLMVEAGTGTGKSMAYLVPCAEAAKRNNISVGIATKTNALLDQLVYKELPALNAAMGNTLSFAPLKGYTHYPCLLKVERILREGPRMKTVSNEEKPQAPALAALLSYMEQTAYDDMDGLKIDYRVLPRGAVTTTSADCLRRRCPFYGSECYVHGSRKLAETADIIVTNHSLLFSDVAAEGALLPPVRYWVVDEAHGAEDEARRALSRSISIDNLDRLARRLGGEDGRSNVFLAALRAAQSAGSADTIFEALVTKATSAGKVFAQTHQAFADQTRELHYFDTQKKSSYELFDLWINQEVRASTIFEALCEAAQQMSDAAEKVIGVSQELVSLMDDMKGAGFAQRELASVALELKETVVAVDAIFTHPSDAFVYSVTLNRRDGKSGAAKGVLKGGNVYHALLYNVGATLGETLYADTRSVVFTSATLTVAGSFEAFATSMGLNGGEGSGAKGLMLESSFDFDANMRIYVVSDMPEPSSPTYLEYLQKFLIDAHIAQGGSMLTLFTNKKDMDRCYEEVSEELRQADLRLVCQRRSVSVKSLRDEFVSNEQLSLFALKSFWEGFDAPGATLKGVIIPKLPFNSPTDPLSLERKGRDDNAWKHFDLPKAVIEVRQAAGRLIRKASDSGVFILADSRLLTKWYGKVFVSSLPSHDVRVMTAAEICEELAR